MSIGENGENSARDALAMTRPDDCLGGARPASIRVIVALETGTTAFFVAHWLARGRTTHCDAYCRYLVPTSEVPVMIVPEVISDVLLATACG